MKIDDAKIQNLLNRAEVSLPEDLDKKTTQLIIEKPEKSFSFNKIWKVSLIPAALALVFAFILFFPVNKYPKGEEISEIRTEFLIKDKNIKIIWIHKKDFKLNLKKEKTL